MKNKFCFQPKVENKYNITILDIEKAKVNDLEKIKQKPFWRNNLINGWCLSGDIIPYPLDKDGTYDLHWWIGIYEKDLSIKIHCTCYGGLCNYKFNEFYKKKQIKDKYDLQLQEQLLEKINWLLDEKIIKLTGY